MSFVAREGRVAGLVAVADPVKETTPQALARLREEGIRAVMLTGDNRATAEAVARRLAHAVRRNIRHNLAFAFGYKAVGVPIAAGALYPVLGILLSPLIAAGR